VHKNVRSSMVKTIFESDVLLRNYREKMEEIRMDVSATVRCNIQIAERFLHSNKLVLIHATTRFYALS
jgi:hypothetical protein